jgi:Domain of unknown function (DUF4340)
MSARLLGILVAVLVVLGGAALWLHHEERASEAPAENMLGEPLLRGLHGADIAMIRISAPDRKLTLRREGARWVVAERDDFPADLAKVRDFVVNALSLKVGQSDSIGAADRARLHLNQPSAAKGAGTLVEFAAADGKPLASLIVGGKYFKRTPDNPKTAKVDGRFVLRPDAGDTAIIVADPLEQVVADGAKWIDRHALAVEDPVSIDVRHADGDHWRLERGPDASGPWKLVAANPGEKLSETTVLSVAAAAGGLDIADVIARDPERVAKDLAKPTVVTIVSRDGLTYTLDIGARADRNYYAVAKVEGDLPEARKPVEGEKAEDAAMRDKAFAAHVAKVRARLPDAQMLAKHAFLIPDTTLVDLTKKRADLLEKKSPAKAH